MLISLELILIVYSSESFFNNGFKFASTYSSPVDNGLLPLLIIAVLGSIFMGIATPTEASGVGALRASILALIRGRLSLNDLKKVTSPQIF